PSGPEDRGTSPPEPGTNHALLAQASSAEPPPARSRRSLRVPATTIAEEACRGPPRGNPCALIWRAVGQRSKPAAQLGKVWSMSRWFLQSIEVNGGFLPGFSL